MVQKIASRDETHWVGRAACRGYDPEIWSLDFGRGDLYDLAHAICAECPVIQRCYDYGVETKSVGVIMGGEDFILSGWRKGPNPTMVCPHCKASFQQRHRNQKYCKPQCADAASSVRYYARKGCG